MTRPVKFTAAQKARIKALMADGDNPAAFAIIMRKIRTQRGA